MAELAYKVTYTAANGFTIVRNVVTDDIAAFLANLEEEGCNITRCTKVQNDTANTRG